MSYLEDLNRLGATPTGALDEYGTISTSKGTYNTKTNSFLGSTPASSPTTYGSGSTLGSDFGPFPVTTTPMTSTAAPTTVSSTNPLSSTVSSSYKSGSAPTYDRSLRNMYVNTFNNPEEYWDEYSQGQGVQFTNNAARGMAKAGRTGMLPALNTMAHQDYMSNYLPSVRKDMAPGLSYESAWNQNLEQQYGDELGHKASIYNSDVNAAGNQLDYQAAMSQLAETARSAQVKEGIDKLNAGLRELEISENTKINLSRDLTTIFKDVSEAEQKIITDQLLAGIGMEGYGTKTLEELLADSSPADYDGYYSRFYDNYVG